MVNSFFTARAAKGLDVEYRAIYRNEVKQFTAVSDDNAIRIALAVKSEEFPRRIVRCRDGIVVAVIYEYGWKTY